MKNKKEYQAMAISGGLLNHPELSGCWAIDKVKLNMICEWCEHGRSVSPLHRADVACGKGRGLRRYNNHCKHFNRMSLDNIKLEGDHE